MTKTQLSPNHNNTDLPIELAAAVARARSISLTDIQRTNAIGGDPIDNATSSGLAIYGLTRDGSNADNGLCHAIKTFTLLIITIAHQLN